MPDVARERQDLRCLEALQDAHDNSAGRQVNALQVLETSGLDFTAAQHWLLDARQRGLVDEIDECLVPADGPTPAGRALVEKARHARQDRSHLRRVAQANLLRWADHSGGNTASFLNSDHAWVAGIRLDQEQVAAAAKALHADGLVEAAVINAWGADAVRVDVTITDQGRTLLDDFDGDIGRWRATHDRHEGVTVNAHGSSVAISSHGSTANASVSGFDTDAVISLASALAAARDALGLDQDDMAQFDRHLVDLQAQHEPTRVRRALAWFSRLGTDVTANALGTMLAATATTLLGGG